MCHGVVLHWAPACIMCRTGPLCGVCALPSCDPITLWTCSRTLSVHMCRHHQQTTPPSCVLTHPANTTSVLPDPQMEGMVTDLQLAKEKQQHFDEWLKVGSWRPVV